MDRYRAMRLTGGSLVLLGVLLLAWAVLQGAVSFALVLIVPVLYGTSPLMAVSMLMVFAGLVLVFMSFFRPAERTGPVASPEGVKKEWGGVILIGPIPIVIGSAGMLRGRGALALLAVLATFMLVIFLFTLLR